MIHCISIKNILTKNKIECNFPVNDLYTFLYRMFEYQQKDILFMYIFDNSDKYITAHDNDEFIIEKVNNDLWLEILERVYDIDYDDTDKKIDSMADRVIKLSVANNIDIKIDKQKLVDFIKKMDNIDNKYSTDIIIAQDKYINSMIEQHKNKEKEKKVKVVQQGGVLIWAFESYILPKLPSIMQNIFFGILEIIDIGLIILSSIPVVGFGFDLISILYCFLRFDMIGLFGAIVSLVPVVGDIGGGLIRGMSKIFRYVTKYRKYRNRINRINNFINPNISTKNK